MAGSDDIVQNVVLAGQAEVIAGFAAISAAGIAAFDSISRAATNTSITGFVASVGELAGAFALATAGMFEFSKASADAIATQARLATQEGTTLEQMSTFIGALSATGANVDGLTAAIKRFAVQTALQFPIVQREVRNAANNTTKDLNSIEQANVSLMNSIIKLGFVEKEQSLQRQQDSKTVKSAVLNLAEQQEKLNALETGQKVNPQVQADIDFDKQALAVEQARLDVQTALKKKAEDAALAPIKALQAQLDVQEKAQQAEAARLKFLEDQGNNILNIKKFIDETTAGIKSDSSGLVLSEQNIVRGLIASVGPGVQAVGELGKSIGDFGASAPRMFPTVLKLADLFKNLGDETTKQAVAVALFGRGFNVSLIESLSLGSGAIKAIADKFHELGFELTSIKEKGEASDEFIEKKLRQSFGTLAAEVNITSKQLANLFSPAFTAILEAIGGALEENRGHIIDWGKSIADAAIPPVVALINLLSGGRANLARLSPAQVADVKEWEKTFNDIFEVVQRWGKNVKDFFLTTLPAVFQTVMNLLNIFADGLNKVFKPETPITGEQLGIGLLIGQLTGLNNTLIGLVAQVPIAASAFVAAFGPEGVAVLAVIAGVALIALNWDTIKEKATSVWDAIAQKWSQSPIDFIFDFEPFNRLVDSLKRLSKEGITIPVLIDISAALFGLNPLSLVIAGLKKALNITDDAKKMSEALNRTEDDWKGITETAEGSGKVQDDAAKKPQTELKKLSSSIMGIQDSYLKAKDSAQKFATEAGGKGQVPSGGIPAQFQGLVEGSAAAAQAIDKNLGSVILKLNQFASQLTSTQQQGIKLITQTSNSMTDGMKAAADAATGIAIRVGKSGTQQFIDIEKAVAALKKQAAETGSAQITIGGQKFIDATRQLEIQKKAMQDADKAAADFRQKMSQGFDEAGFIDIEKHLDDIKVRIENLKQQKPIQLLPEDQQRLQQQDAIPFTNNPFGKILEQIDPLQQKIDELASAFSGKLDDSVQEVAKTIESDLTSGIEAFAEQSLNALDELIAKFKEADDAAKQLDPGTPQQDNTDLAFAGGGLLRGKSGKDTNLAWLSDWEYILRPEATLSIISRHGRGVLDWINATGKLPGFNLGGLVEGLSHSWNAPRMIPAYAAGGLHVASSAGDSRNVTVHLKAGNRSLGTVTASDAVAENMARLASHARIVAASKTPDWYT